MWSEGGRVVVVSFNRPGTTGSGGVLVQASLGFVLAQPPRASIKDYTGNILYAGYLSALLYLL